MAGSIVINGQETGIPGVYAIPEFLKLQSRAPLTSILAVVGEFPFLEQNTPYLSTDQATFDALSPSNVTLKKLSNIIFEASNDPAAQNSPAGVYLISPTATTQAIGYLQDATPANSIKLSSKQWGTEGNRTRFTIVENATLGGWDVSIRNGSYVENFRVPAEPTLMTLDYAPTYSPAVTIPTGFEHNTGVTGSVTGAVSLANTAGSVDVTFSRTVDEGCVVVTGSPNWSWYSYAPVDGVLTFNSDAPATFTPPATGPLNITISGINKTTGLADTESLVWTKTDIEAQTAKVSTKSWTGPVYVRFHEASSVSFVGEITITGSVFPTFNAANGQTYVADVISYLSGYASKGFVVSTNSSRSASIKLTELDNLTVGTLPQTLSADLWKIQSTIAAQSLLVDAERVGNSPPDVTTTATQFYLAGGTEVGATATDWENSLSELEWYDIDVVAPLYDPTGTAAASDTILPKFVAHAQKMWGVGANERILWLPVGDDETFSQLTARQVAHGSEYVSMPIDAVSLVQYNNQTEEMLPYWNAVLMAAFDASTTGLTPLTYRSPRVTSYRRNSALYSREAREALIKGGFVYLIDPPGLSPQVQRDITSYTADQDVRRTERVPMRSLMLSLKSMRRALRGLMTLENGAVATGSDVRAAVLGELDRQKRYGIFKSFDPSKVSIRSYADRFEVDYEFTPVYPVNFIVIRAKVSAPVTQTF